MSISTGPTRPPSDTDKPEDHVTFHIETSKTNGSNEYGYSSAKPRVSISQSGIPAAVTGNVIQTGESTSSLHGHSTKHIELSDFRTIVNQVIFFFTDRDYNLWIMTFAFVLLFFAYPIQGVQTIRYPATGSYILLVLYAAYGITSLFATPIIDLIGPEFCMPFGAFTYALWIASEFSGNDGLVLAGAAAFGWGAGLMWPAAGNILATISSPHNRGSNNGIFQFGFHLGVFSGGLTLGGVIKAFDNYDDQYAVFIGLCTASLITFIIFIFTFRARYRIKVPATSGNTNASAADPSHHPLQGHGQGTTASSSSFRVVRDDGRIEYRETLDKDMIKDKDIVVASLALSGGRGTVGRASYTWESLKDRMYQSIQFLWNPIFAPCLAATASIGGINQGWFNASFNILANYAGAEWVGWVYAISESFGMVSAVLFGLFYDKLRTNYKPHQYRWLMYYSFAAVYCMCATAMGAAYLAETYELGDGPGQLKPSYYYAILIVTCFFYNTSWLAFEISIYTYLTTFLVYNADIGFSTKIFCEAMGYMVSYGLSDVLSPKQLTIVLFCAHAPAFLTYLIWFKAPDTPAPMILEVRNADESVKEVIHAVAAKV